MLAESYCSVDFDFFALMRFDMTFDFFALMRLDMTFDVTLRDVSSFCKLTNSCKTRLIFTLSGNV